MTLTSSRDMNCTVTLVQLVYNGHRHTDICLLSVQQLMLLALMLARCIYIYNVTNVTNQ